MRRKDESPGTPNNITHKGFIFELVTSSDVFTFQNDTDFLNLHMVVLQKKIYGTHTKKIATYDRIENRLITIFATTLYVIVIMFLNIITWQL